MRKTNIVVALAGIGLVGLISYVRVLNSEGLSIKAALEIGEICKKNELVCADILNAMGVTAYVMPDWRALVQILLTAALMAASLIVVLSNKYTPAQKHWAYGMIGTLLGFWLKP